MSEHNDYQIKPDSEAHTYIVGIVVSIMGSFILLYIIVKIKHRYCRKAKDYRKVDFRYVMIGEILHEDKLM